MVLITTERLFQATVTLTCREKGVLSVQSSRFGYRSRHLHRFRQWDYLDQQKVEAYRFAIAVRVSKSVLFKASICLWARIVAVEYAFPTLLPLLAVISRFATANRPMAKIEIAIRISKIENPFSPNFIFSFSRNVPLRVDIFPRPPKSRAGLNPCVSHPRKRDPSEIVFCIGHVYMSVHIWKSRYR